MRFSMDSNMQFPLVELSLNQGETVFIQRGSTEEMYVLNTRR